MTGHDPWSDPSTPTEQAPPYAGPPYAGPPYAGPPYAGPPYAGPPYQGQPYPGAGYGPPPPQYGWPPAGGYPWPYAYAPYPWWTVPPPGPRRPGQVVGAAVLAFVQAALVAFASLYVFLIASVVGLASDQSLQVPGDVRRLATEGRVVAGLQLASVVLLVVAGSLALSRPRRSAWYVLLAAFGVQVALALYWSVRLATVAGDVPGSSPGASFLGLSLFFAAPPVVGLGLVLFGPGRQWFAASDSSGVRQPGAG